MMQAEEFRRMSDEHKGGGSDLDIFEGLGRKNSEKVPVAPPAPPGSSSHLQTARQTPIDAKRTLLGIPGPATALGSPPAPPSTRPSTAGLEASHPASGAMRTANGKTSDSPPGRGSLPNLPTSKSNPPIVAAAPVAAPAPAATEPFAGGPAPLPVAQRTSATHRVPSDPPPPYNPAARRHSSHPPPAIVKARNGKLDAHFAGDQPDPYDDGDDAAETNVFDRNKVNAEKSALAEKRAIALAPTEQFAQVPMMAPPPATLHAPSTQNAGGSGQRMLQSSDGLDTLVASPAQQAASELASAQGDGDSNKSIPEPPDTASLSAAFAALGESVDRSEKSAPISKGMRSAPPASGSMRSVPPPPPPSMQKAGLMTQPLMQPPPPPPPNAAASAPGMQTLPSMQQMPIPAPPSTQSVPPPPVTQPYALQSPSSPPPSVHPSAAPPPVQSLPPVARLDATYTFPKKEKSGNGFVLAVLLTVVAIAGAAVFMFTPRTGNLVIGVTGANGAPVQKLEVSVDGAKRCDTAPCIVRDVAAGPHSVSVNAPGYDPVAARVVNVESRKDATSDFSLVAAKTVASAGTGVKVTAPAGAKLQIDGKDVGTIPVEIKDLTPGDHKLHFSGDRYAALDKTITVGKDEMVDVGSVPLKVTKGRATIQLGTPGAKVELVMGTTHKEVPQFPIAIDFDPNEKWELRATKDGMDPYSEKIAFEDGQAEKTFNVTLQPKGTAAKEKAASQPAVVAHNDSSSTPAPAKAKSTPKEASDGEEAPAKPSKTASASKSEASGDTALKINSLPSSSVVLDGKPIGVTPLPHVTVTPGTHTIMFVNSEESLKKTITVEVKAGETKAAVAKLRE